MENFNKKIVVIAAFLGALTIAIGAFGAHGLKELVDANALKSFETGVRYQMYHALALLLLPALSITSTWGNRVAFCFVIGTVLFSGSLYALSISGIKWFGPITPLGGLFFIVGWGLLVIGLIKGNKSVNQQTSHKSGASNV